MKQKHNNKGFSLIEVLIAVTIVGILSIPLVLAFTVSANTSAKARKKATVNLAVSNMIECIDAAGGCDAFLTDATVRNPVLGSTFTIKQSKYASYIKEDSTGKKITVKNMKVGNTYYDGVVEFSLDADSVKDLNNQNLAKFSKIDGFFLISDYNCDTQAESDFNSSYTGVKTDIVRKREMTVKYYGVYDQNSDTPKSVNLVVTFAYTFTKNGEVVFNNSYSYYVLSSYDYDTANPPRVYISYTPYYASSNNIDIIKVDIDNDIDGRIFLIKTKTSDTTESNEAGLITYITVDTATTKEKAIEMVYTNANLNIATNKETANYNFFVRLKSNYMNYTISHSNVNTKLLEYEITARAYNVKVSIYPKGSISDDNLIFSYETVMMR